MASGSLLPPGGPSCFRSSDADADADAGRPALAAVGYLGRAAREADLGLWLGALRRPGLPRWSSSGR